MKDDAGQLRILAVVFLGCGMIFLGVGGATRMLPFLTLGPSLVVLGVAFLAVSKRRRRS